MQALTTIILKDKSMITIYSDSEENSQQVANEVARQAQAQSNTLDNLPYVDIDQRIQRGLEVLESVEWSKK